MKELLTKELATTHEQGNKAKWKGKAMKDDDMEYTNF